MLYDLIDGSEEWLGASILTKRTKSAQVVTWGIVKDGIAVVNPDYDENTPVEVLGYGLEMVEKNCCVHDVFAADDYVDIHGDCVCVVRLRSV
jgi:hypothetical protein